MRRHALCAWWKCLPFALVLCAPVSCAAQTTCSTATLADAAGRVRRIRKELKQIQVQEMETSVPAAARDQLILLKDALVCATDAAFVHAAPTLEPGHLQDMLAGVLGANPPEASEGAPALDPSGPYGRTLSVRVSRSSAGLLEVEFSVSIPCGDDHMLLIYAIDDGAWRKQVRWQSPPMETISDAFGGFFLSAILPAPAGGDFTRGVVVAHGTPWCTSRISGFAIDILVPGPDPNSPKILWHTRRGYSRGDFRPRLKWSGDTFELRVNGSSMDIEVFERRVIYRYRIDERRGVRRMQPIALHARGFVEEWLSAPWSESRFFTAQGAGSALAALHDQFAAVAESPAEFIRQEYGPVRACHAPGTYQVELRSTREKLGPGKPGGQPRALPTHYFQVREIPGGYLMMSAPTEPDPGCKGADLMPAKD